MNIPNNATLEEAIKYFLPRDIADIVESTLAPFIERTKELEEELQKSYRDNELLEEADGFKEQLLEEIQSLCKQTGSKDELIKGINLAFDDSYVEM